MTPIGAEMHREDQRAQWGKQVSTECLSGTWCTLAILILYSTLGTRCYFLPFYMEKTEAWSHKVICPHHRANKEESQDLNASIADSKFLFTPPCFLCKIPSTNLSPFLDSRKLGEIEGRVWWGNQVCRTTPFGPRSAGLQEGREAPVTAAPSQGCRRRPPLPRPKTHWAKAHHLHLIFKIALWNGQDLCSPCFTGNQPSNLKALA